MILCWWSLIRGLFSTKRNMWSRAEVTAGTCIGQLQHSPSVVMGYNSRKRRDGALGSRGCFTLSSHPQYFFHLSNGRSEGDILRVGVPSPYVPMWNQIPSKQIFSIIYSPFLSTPQLHFHFQLSVPLHRGGATHWGDVRLYRGSVIWADKSVLWVNVCPVRAWRCAVGQNNTLACESNASCVLCLFTEICRGSTRKPKPILALVLECTVFYNSEVLKRSWSINGTRV